MTHQEKVNRLCADLGAQGVDAKLIAPPLFKLMWALGITLPPPLFMGFIPLTLIFGPIAGIPFGILWGCGMWLVQWQHLQMSVEWAIAGSVVAGLGFGLFFGIFAAGFIRWKAARLLLPAWHDYPDG